VLRPQVFEARFGVLASLLALSDDETVFGRNNRRNVLPSEAMSNALFWTTDKGDHPDKAGLAQKNEAPQIAIIYDLPFAGRIYGSSERRGGVQGLDAPLLRPDIFEQALQGRILPTGARRRGPGDLLPVAHQSR